MGVAMACGGCGAMITVSPNFKGRRASCSACRKEKEKENRGGGGPTGDSGRDRPGSGGADHVHGGRYGIPGKASRGGGGGGGGGKGPGNRNRQAEANVIVDIGGPGRPPPPQPGTNETIHELQGRRAAEMGKLRSLGAAGDDGEFNESNHRTNMSVCCYVLLCTLPVVE